MPALRNGHPAVFPRNRRRSSVFTPAKAGIYGVGRPSAASPSALSILPPRPISFAPNVTPGTFVESDDSSPSSPEPLSPNSMPKLFPPSETPAPPPTRKRCPPGKRRSQGYIPRPPNAFMLFRADFVRQKHVPGSIETNHGSLSKIIGNCWRSLPLEEKKVWEQKAKHEKAAHKLQYPNYRFRPIHNKKKKQAEEASQMSSEKDKKKQLQTPEEEIRCEELTQLLLEGKKGDELAQAARELDERRRIKMREFMKSKGQSLTPGPFAAPQRPIAFTNGLMTAPQPTYPNPMMSGTSDNFFPGDNAAAGSFLHLRRSSSVPLPGFDFNNMNFGVNGGGMSMDYFMPPPAYSELPLSAHQHQHQHQHDQASDPNSAITIPSVPFLPPPSSAGISGIANTSLNSDGTTTDDSNILNVASISKQQRMLLGHRRSSSAGPAFGGIQRSWTTPHYGYGYFEGAAGLDSGDYGSGNIMVQRDDSPLPDINVGLFDPNFLNGSSVASQGTPAPEDPTAPHSMPGTTNTTPNGAFNVSELVHVLPPTLGPLDTTGFQHTHHAEMMSPHDVVSSNESYWSTSNASNIYQPQPQQHGHGLGLEVGPLDVPPEATPANSPPASNYDQMYLAEQNTMAMDMGYGPTNAGGYADAGSYNYNHLDMGMQMQTGGVQYVEC